MKFPDAFENESQLDDFLTTPSESLLEEIKCLESPLVILGAGGKMGPTLAVLANNAARLAGHKLKVIAASRFRNLEARQWLQDRGVETLEVDVFDREQLKQLPDTANVVYLVGMKFGTSTNPVPTWVTNTLGPIYASERYAGSKVVALSTGNVYPMVSIQSGGCVESHALTPLGEYANAAIARERLFEYFATLGSSPNPTAIVRLNYAHDLRYGVMSDIAAKVWHDQPISLDVGYFNAIWQGDANEIILKCFQLCTSPTTALNMTSPTIYSVRDVATRFGQLMKKRPTFVGAEQTTALLSNAQFMKDKFGEPSVGLDQMIQWISDWTQRGGRTLNKPTHFESRDGRY